MRHAFLLIACGLVLRGGLLFAQPAPADDFVLTKVSRSLITAPIFSYSGAQSFDIEREARWLAVEADFSAQPEFTDELTLRYYVLINGKLLKGEVTHVNISAGRDNHSVMYLPPRALARFVRNPTLIEKSIQNIAVQIVQAGVVKSELSLLRGSQPRWFADIPKVSGMLLNKHETPFAPLYWEHYLQIKTGGL